MDKKGHKAAADKIIAAYGEEADKIGPVRGCFSLCFPSACRFRVGRWRTNGVWPIGNHLDLMMVEETMLDEAAAVPSEAF